MTWNGSLERPEFYTVHVSKTVVESKSAKFSIFYKRVCIFMGVNKKFCFLRDNKNNSVNQNHSFLGKKMEINKRFAKVNEFATAECNILSVKKHVQYTVVFTRSRGPGSTCITWKTHTTGCFDYIIAFRAGENVWAASIYCLSEAVTHLILIIMCVLHLRIHLFFKCWNVQIFIFSVVKNINGIIHKKWKLPHDLLTLKPS